MKNENTNTNFCDLITEKSSRKEVFLNRKNFYQEYLNKIYKMHRQLEWKAILIFCLLSLCLNLLNPFLLKYNISSLIFNQTNLILDHLLLAFIPVIFIIKKIKKEEVKITKKLKEELYIKSGINKSIKKYVIITKFYSF